MRADGSKNLWIVRSFVIHNRFFLYPFIFSFVHLKRRLKWRAIIKVDWIYQWVWCFRYYPTWAFRALLGVVRQFANKRSACKKVVWYNYVEQNDIQKNSLQKENEFVIQFPKKGTKCEKWLCMKLTLAACKNKWSNLQKYDRKWKLTTEDYSKQVLTTKLIPYNNLQEIIQSNNWQKVNTNIFR